MLVAKRGVSYEWNRLLQKKRKKFMYNKGDGPARLFYVHPEEIPLYESVHISVRSGKTLARDCRIRDSMFLFLAGFFFSMSSCKKKNLLFCLKNLTALIYLLAYLPYVMFKITVVLGYSSSHLPPPTEELFDVEMCAFKNSYIER